MGPSKSLEIVIVGTQQTDELTLARYNANGSLDTSFGTKGTVSVPFASYFEAPTVGLDPETNPLDPNASGASCKIVLDIASKYALKRSSSRRALAVIAADTIRVFRDDGRSDADIRTELLGIAHDERHRFGLRDYVVARAILGQLLEAS